MWETGYSTYPFTRGVTHGKKKNLQELWEDLYYLDVSKKHYFGTVLLLDSKRVTQVGMKTLKRLDVIDGQQRLTSILILLREIISQAKVVGEEEVREQVEGLERGLLEASDALQAESAE